MDKLVFYHGTDNGNLEKLLPNHSLYNSKVFVTSNKDIAIWYCVRTQWYMYGFNKETNKPFMIECSPNMLKKMYGGKTGYIYTCEDKKGYVEYKTNVPDSFCINEEVKLIDKEIIPDVYEYLLNRAKQGKIDIKMFEDMSLEEQQKRRNKFIDNLRKLCSKPEEIEYFKNNFPEEYKESLKTEENK